jgi:protein gp37
VFGNHCHAPDRIDLEQAGGLSRARLTWSQSATWTPATGRTSLAAGSKFGYALLTIVIAATIIALNVKLIVDQIVGQSARRLIYGLSTRVQPVDINRSCGRKRPL